MKTKEEVLEHLLTEGYTDKAIDKILGFMIAVGLKDINEVVRYKKGDLLFEYFYDWYNDNLPKEEEEEEEDCLLEFDYCPKCALNSLIEDTMERYASITWDDERLESRIEKQLFFLMDIQEMLEDKGCCSED